jgi:phage terminase large subunit-like protein
MADDDTPDPASLIKIARKTQSSAERRKKYQKLDFLGLNFFYPTQLKFFAAGSSGVHQRLIYGGSQTGKTTAAAAEVAWHVTGNYPSWWVGHRFAAPIRCWVVGESSTLVRDTIQRQLCGGQEFGTGTIPLESFGRKPIMIAGGTGGIDTVFITHMTDGKVDGTSSITFKSFEMRREKLQSETLDLVWIDERPDELVYSELYARTSAVSGHLIVSYTPIGDGGASGVTYKFLSEPSPDRSVHRITSGEVKHISAERHEELSAGYSDAERETRLEGVPQLGSGPVFPVELLPALIKSFNPDDLPTYARWCCGIDFGFDHPFAAVLIAWAHDTGQIWVVDSFRMERSSALYHTQRIHAMTRGLRVPIAYPHDGHVHDKGSGLSLAGQYKSFGANMMGTHATNHGSTNYNVEPALEEMRSMMFANKITIAGHNSELLEEMRHYHRSEDFRLVKQRDDLVCALRYAVMMRRSGRPLSDCDGIGYGPMPWAAQRRSGGEQQIARGVDFDVFSGQ